MFYLKKVSRCLKITLLICCYFALPVQAQDVFKVYPDYSAVSVGDTLLLSYQYTGAERLTFFDAHLKEVQIIDGPEQSWVSQSSETGGKLTTTRTTTIRYHLKMNNPGSFTIPAAAAKDYAGKSHFTNPVIIEVKDGPFKKVLNNVPGEDAIIKALSQDLNQQDKTQQAIATLPYPYVLITGFVYHRVSESSQSKPVRITADSFITGKARTLWLGTVTHNFYPRNYYNLKDTAGIRKKLQDIYSNAGFHSRYLIMLMKKEDWKQGSEYRIFERAETLWTEIDKWTGYIAPAKKTLLNKWEVQFKCVLTDPEDLKSLSTFATRNGYSLDSKYNQQTGIYTLLLKKQSDIIAEHLFDMGTELMKETEKFKGDNNQEVSTGYAGMTIQMVPQNKQ
jgi:hypothetical protein